MCLATIFGVCITPLLAAILGLGTVILVASGVIFLANRDVFKDKENSTTKIENDYVIVHPTAPTATQDLDDDDVVETYKLLNGRITIEITWSNVNMERITIYNNTREDVLIHFSDQVSDQGSLPDAIEVLSHDNSSMLMNMMPTSFTVAVEIEDNTLDEDTINAADQIAISRPFPYTE